MTTEIIFKWKIWSLQHFRVKCKSGTWSKDKHAQEIVNNFSLILTIFMWEKAVFQYFGLSLINNQQGFSHSTLKACLIRGVSAANESLSWWCNAPELCFSIGYVVTGYHAWAIGKFWIKSFFPACPPCLN